jgi:hypothetical protein
VATILAMLVGLWSCRSPGAPADPVRIEIPEGVTAPWAAISPEGRGWAYTELRRSEAFMVANGRRLGPYS